MDELTSCLFSQAQNLVERHTISPHLTDFRPLGQVQTLSDELCDVLHLSVDHMAGAISRKSRLAVLHIKEELVRLQQVPHTRRPASKVVHKYTVLEEGILQTTLGYGLFDGPLEAEKTDWVVRLGPSQEFAWGETLDASLQGSIYERKLRLDRGSSVKPVDGDDDGVDAIEGCEQRGRVVVRDGDQLRTETLDL